jgi:hypothetical protein
VSGVVRESRDANRLLVLGEVDAEPPGQTRFPGWLPAIGFVPDLPAARFAVRWIADMLGATQPGDPLAYGFVCVFTVALLATRAPVRYVTCVDLLVALREG